MSSFTLPPLYNNQGKTITFIRHAESLYNVHYNTFQKDVGLVDAPLSNKGIEMAQNMRRLVCNTLDPQLIIMSPLTRSIETGLIAFPYHEYIQKKCKYEIWAEHREVLEAWCDIGYTPSFLEDKFGVIHRDIKFDHLPEVWWYVDPSLIDPNTKINDAIAREIYRMNRYVEPEEEVEARMDLFMSKLRQCKEHNIVVVGHSDFFNRLLKKYFGMEDYWMENTEVITKRIDH